MYYVENRKYPSPFVSLLPIVVLIILLFSRSVCLELMLWEVAVKSVCW